MTRYRKANDWLKGIASWRAGRTLYLSVPFTWMLNAARAMAEDHGGPAVAGGPAVDLVGADWAETPGECPYDTLSMHNPLATFTSRGCPNRCPYCSVPKTEGDFRELSSWKVAPIVCDNNLLASSRGHFERVVDSLVGLDSVDFNQGLDARLFTSWHAGQLARLKHPKVRFALDHVKHESAVADAIATGRSAGLRDFAVYVLIGFRDDHEDALYRLEKVREWGIRPNPMRYQPLDAQRKDAYVAPGWDEEMLKKVMRYYSRLRWTAGIPFEDWDNHYGAAPVCRGISLRKPLRFGGRCR